MTAFFKANGDYTINGYTFTSAGLHFPDGSVQSSASTGSGGGGSSGPVTWTSVLNRPTTLSAFTNDVGFITSASLAWNSITSKPTLFSGSYTDLTNKPVIPTVPTALSSLTNDSGYITSASLTWNNITSKPVMFDASTVASNVIPSSNATYSLGDDTKVWSSVHTSTLNATYITANGSGGSFGQSLMSLGSGGLEWSYPSYNNLLNKPTIPTVPTALSAFTNDSGYLTSVSWTQVTGKPTLFSGSYNDLTDKPIIPSTVGLASEMYVNIQVSNLVNAAPSTLDTLNELAAALGNDANYATTISNQLGLKANTSSLATVATSGSYTDLTNKPTIPTAVSQLTNDSGYITITETLSPFLLMGA